MTVAILLSLGLSPSLEKKLLKEFLHKYLAQGLNLFIVGFGKDHIITK